MLWTLLFGLCYVIDQSACLLLQSCAVDPGAVSSNIYANSRLPSPIRWFIRNMHAPTRDGARAVLHAATAPWPPLVPQHAQQYKPHPRELRVSLALTSTALVCGDCNVKTFVAVMFDSNQQPYMHPLVLCVLVPPLLPLFTPAPPPLLPHTPCTACRLLFWQVPTRAVSAVLCKRYVCVSCYWLVLCQEGCRLA